MSLTVRAARPEDAAAVVEVVHEAFTARPALDPPSTALEETVDSVREAIEEHGGLIAHLDGRPVGALLLHHEGSTLRLRRVSVLPRAQRAGVARALAEAADQEGTRRGATILRLEARAELPGTVRFWTRAGYTVVDVDGPHLTMAKALPLEIEVPTGEDMQRLGAAVAGHLKAGDVLVLTGDLGAGKTTFTQGLGRGLGVRGDVTSPTFVISRVHPSVSGGPALVHVDAYRLGGVAELDDLDLDVSLEDSVTVVEWGEGIAEGLADDRLEIRIVRAVGDAGEGELRTVRLSPVGARWLDTGLAAVVTGSRVA